MIYHISEDINPLYESLRQGRLAILAGSGISREHPSCIPTWKGMIKEFSKMFRELTISKEKKTELLKIADQVDASLKEGDMELIRLASILKKQIQRLGLNNITTAKIGYSNWVTKMFLAKEENEYHKAIIKTNYKHVLTTNYDILLELAASRLGYEGFEGNSFSFRDEVNIMKAIQNNLSSIIHIHGIVKGSGDIDELIFTKEDYNNIVYNKYPGLSFALRMIFTTCPVLFVGYGASDPHLEEVFEELNTMYPKNEEELVNDKEHCIKYPVFPYSYLLCRKDQEMLQNYKSDYRINLITYDNHNQVKEFLIKLSKINPRVI